MEPEYDIANPKSHRLFESLRAFGYDLSTAIADIVDNSISAAAKNVWIEFQWDGEKSRVVIRDDGRGMSEARLVEAMAPGSESPLEPRSERDLGRFGLGMKTASISQCRCLTVMSRQDGLGPSWRRWDLDYIKSLGTGEWRLLKGQQLLSEADRTLLDGSAHGTVVIWDRLDQLVGNARADDSEAQRQFRARVDAVKAHLAMTFHRFLLGNDSLSIMLNARPIEPWDPFLQGAAATDPLPSENLGRGTERVVVRPFVLPHHSKLSAAEHSSAAGPNGWNAHQGFYIYRNRRLLVAGDWLGLGMQKEEHYKLARIQVDISNAADLHWQIDVKKSQAKPPDELRSDLLRIAKATRNRAANIYRHRGRVLQRANSDERVFLWSHLRKHGKSFYKISRGHPLVKKVLDTASDRKLLVDLLNLIENTVPAPLITIQNAESPDSLGGPFEDDGSAIESAMVSTFNAMVEQGSRPADAARSLLMMEPFNHYPELVAAFIEKIAHGLHQSNVTD